MLRGEKKMSNRLYILRYGILDSNIIFNECGPHSGGPEGWDEESIEKRDVIAQRLIKTLNDDRGFYINLEASILKDGFRNPILVNAGWCPKIRDRGKNGRLPIEMQEDHSKILSCNQNGGSRLYIAQKNNLQIPCIVVDYVDRFSEFELLETKEDILEHYTDRPKKVMMLKDSFRIYHLPQAS